MPPVVGLGCLHFVFHDAGESQKKPAGCAAGLKDFTMLTVSLGHLRITTQGWQNLKGHPRDCQQHGAVDVFAKGSLEYT